MIVRPEFDAINLAFESQPLCFMIAELITTLIFLGVLYCLLRKQQAYLEIGYKPKQHNKEDGVEYVYQEHGRYYDSD